MSVPLLHPGHAWIFFLQTALELRIAVRLESGPIARGPQTHSLGFFGEYQTLESAGQRFSNCSLIKTRQFQFGHHLCDQIYPLDELLDLMLEKRQLKIAFLPRLCEAAA